LTESRPWQQQALIVAAAVAIAALLRLALHPVLQERVVFLTFLIAVAVCAHAAGLWAGLGGAAVSVGVAFLLQWAIPGGIGLRDWMQVVLFMAAVVPLSILGGLLRSALEREHTLLHAQTAARAEAEQASRLKDEFLAVLSHELRSPLNAMVGWTHVLKTMDMPPEAARPIEIILRNADHQVKLISDISAVAQVITGHLVLDAAILDVRSVVEQAVESVRLAADARGLRLSVRLPGEPLRVRGDGNRLQQVLWNILSNAIKFSASDGLVEVSAEAAGGEVVVSVKDAGHGMGPEFVPHAFDTFRQEDSSKARRFGGLGLGLAIVRHLIEAHGGTAHAESPGRAQGATVTVRLPRFTGPPAVHPAAEEARGQLGGVRILVVEDDRDARELLARELSRQGAQVVLTASAEEARAQLSVQPPDAIVSDIGMPEEDGLTFLRRLRREPQHRHIPAIALSAYASTADHVEALKAGYADHLAKPVSSSELARAITAALGARADRAPH
jgi:signal transduction histidine kinase/ActR/RegA family two-component response regulator